MLMCLCSGGLSVFGQRVPIYLKKISVDNCSKRVYIFKNKSISNVCFILYLLYLLPHLLYKYH